MKKSELYYMAQIAVINAACIAPERKLQILRALMADEDSEKYFEELAEKKKLKNDTVVIPENKTVEVW